MRPLETSPKRRIASVANKLALKGWLAQKQEEHCYRSSLALCCLPRQFSFSRGASVAANIFANSPMPAVNVACAPQRSPSRHSGGKTWLIPTRRRRVIQRGRCCGRA